MNNHFYGPFFRFCRGLVRIFLPKFSTDACEIRNEPVVYVSRHQNLFGPVITLLSFPVDLHCWTLHVFMEKKACYKHYAEYTFSERFGWNKFFAKPLAYLTSRIIPPMLKSGKGIPVYRGSRKILDTFKQSACALQNNERIVIFPDVDYSDDSAEVGKIYEGFLHIEKYYYRKTGKHVCFVPLYASKRQKSLLTGGAIYFRDGEAFKSEQKFVAQKLRDELNRLAKQSGDIE